MIKVALRNGHATTATVDDSGSAATLIGDDLAYVFVAGAGRYTMGEAMPIAAASFSEPEPLLSDEPLCTPYLLSAPLVWYVSYIVCVFHAHRGDLGALQVSGARENPLSSG